MRRQVINLGIFLFVLYLLVGCATADEPTDAKGTKQTEAVEQMEEAEQIELEEDVPEELVETTEEITFSAVGDVLIHARVYNDAKVEDGYDFYPNFKPVKKYLSDTTVTFANQETMIGGEEFGLSTYPAFNSPVEVGEVLREVGVDIVSIANNHTLDRGENVIQGAIRNWEALNMMYVGSYKDEADRDTLRIIKTEEGISLGFIAYTYGTNGIPIPEGKDYLVNLIDRDQIAKDISEMKEATDVVIVSMHFGDEYVRLPNEEQRELVQLIADEGADVVLGHHPHVLQPIEWVEGIEGNETLAIYSLGNFLSGQTELYQKIGGILKFTISKTTKADESEIEVHSPKFVLTYNADQDNQEYIVLPWSEVTSDQLTNHEDVYAEMYEHMTQWLPELEFVE